MTKIMAGAPYEHSSLEMLMGGQPADIIDDARRQQRPDAVDSDGDNRPDGGNDAQRRRHSLREELVEQEAERLAGLGVITRRKPCPKKCSPSLFFVPKQNKTVRFVSDLRYTENNKRQYGLFQ